MWIDKDETLVEHRNKDTWQLPVVSKDGEYLGNVIGQIVDPYECIVRYFLIYSPKRDVRFLLPSDTVVAIDDEVDCGIEIDRITQIPYYEESIDREEEATIYSVLAQAPYWEYEHM